MCGNLLDLRFNSCTVVIIIMKSTLIVMSYLSHFINGANIKSENIVLCKYNVKSLST